MVKLIRMMSWYGTPLALVILCAALSILTLKEQHPVGEAAGRQVAHAALAHWQPGSAILIVARVGPEDSLFAKTAQAVLEAPERRVVVVQGTPQQTRQVLQQLSDQQVALSVIAATHATSDWMILSQLGQQFPQWKSIPIVQPVPYRWPTFLRSDNLLNVANSIAVFAILAIGLTFVIISGGIDLSVGSLVAFATVLAARLIRDLAGGPAATDSALIMSSIAGIAACGVIGAIVGALIVGLEIPPFIVTLAMMMVARGAAYLLADGQAIPELPPQATWLGRDVGFLSIPHTVTLMIVLYIVAHLALSRTVWGRHLYAVGDNRRAAFLSGIPVRATILTTYILSGLLAGIGGIVVGSTFQSGDPRYGEMYELYVIAAVVVGGTSLSGGRGTIVGTLLGSLIIGVINNGMNLLMINTYVQQIILGLVILIAVLLDRLQPTRR